MRIVFMGTPDFAVATLEALLRGGHRVEAAVTQPDKPKGRGKAVLMTPVKEKALEHGIPVYQPVRVRGDEAFFETLRSINPDVIVVTAFGQILPKEILTLPRYGCVNVHASLLPRYRGAAPIQWAVLNGDREAGVTTMQMDEGLDTGDMLEKASLLLDPKETGGSLFERLGALGGELILSTLAGLEAGTITPAKQPEEGASYVKMLSKEMGEMDWSRSAAELERKIRGLNPWPSAYTHLGGKTLKIWEADVESCDDGSARPSPSETPFSSGQIAAVEKDRFLIQTGDGLLAVRELQLEGKKRMDTAAFLRGYPLTAGTQLGKAGE